MTGGPVFHDGFRVVEDGQAWTAPIIRGLVEAWAGALGPTELRRNEPVAVWASNEIRFLFALLSLRRTGAAVVPLHPRWTGPEVAWAVEHSGARLLWVSPALRAKVPTLGTCTVAPIPGPQESFGLPRLQGPVHALPTSYLLYTSGTEGRPRGVLLDDANFRAHAEASRNRLLPSKDERWLAALPFAHVGGLAMLLRCLQSGTTLVLPPDPLTPVLEPAIRERQITHVSLVPRQLRHFLDQLGDAPPPPKLRLVLVGGAASPAELLERARSKDVPVRSTYGLSEACSQVATADAYSPAGSVGRPVADAEVRVEDGEILVRGPGVMVAYHADPEATKKTIRDGWLHTGDLGHLDEHGNLWIEGRRSRRIITGGENVDPSEVERVLEGHPHVAEACVVGLPDREWGEIVAAAVVPRTGAQPQPGDLIAHCRGSLAPFKCPKRIDLVEALPRNSGGKVVASAVQRDLRDERAA